MMELCERTPIIKRKKAGNRQKLATTIDQALFDKLMDLYAKGYSVSHLIDSALWNFFDKPKLSFQISDDSDE